MTSEKIQPEALTEAEIDAVAEELRIPLRNILAGKEANGDPPYSIQQIHENEAETDKEVLREFFDGEELSPELLKKARNPGTAPEKDELFSMTLGFAKAGQDVPYEVKKAIIKAKELEEANEFMKEFEGRGPLNRFGEEKK